MLEKKDVQLLEKLKNCAIYIRNWMVCVSRDSVFKSECFRLQKKMSPPPPYSPVLLKNYTKVYIRYLRSIDKHNLRNY